MFTRKQKQKREPLKYKATFKNLSNGRLVSFAYSSYGEILPYYLQEEKEGRCDMYMLINTIPLTEGEKEKLN